MTFPIELPILFYCSSVKRTCNWETDNLKTLADTFSVIEDIQSDEKGIDRYSGI